MRQLRGVEHLQLGCWDAARADLWQRERVRMERSRIRIGEQKCVYRRQFQEH